MGRTTGTTAVDGARRAEIAVIGSGPGGAVTATLLAQAGCDVALIEEGAHLPLSSAPHFSREEILQKYRNGGINIAVGKAKVAYVEGRCVGGGSEINRGLYHRIAPETLDGWRRDYRVEALSADELRPHFDSCEQIARVSFLPGEAPQLSLRLQAGAAVLGWRYLEAPRLFSYAADWRTGAPGVKQSMTETFVPRFLAAGGRLVSQTQVRRLACHNGRWQLRALQDAGERGQREIEIVADTVVVACGAVQTPALLRRSGITHNVGDQLRWHPMVKVVACFTEPVNQLSELEPVHQIKEFEPRFSMGCSISKRPALALALIEHPGGLAEVARNWRHMAIYYVQSTGGSGTVRPLPGFRDPLVRARHVRADMVDLAEGLTKLCTCLFAAGATAIYPGVSGLPVLRSEADLRQIPRELPAARANLTALHLFSSCPMGEDQRRCAVDSFGRVHGVDRLYVADASLLCGPTVVNPQGTVMAVAHRNAQQLLDGDWRRARVRVAPAPREGGWMRHLITGGSGFIGNLVARRLRERGEQVRVLDVWADPSRPPDIEYVECSVTDRDGVARAMQGMDVVHHNAALVAQTDAGRQYWQVNVEGSRIVAEAAARAGVQAIIHTSSTSVYGIPEDQPITSTTPTRPVEPYGRSKLAGERAVEEVCQRHGIPLLTIRPRATLGAGRLGIFQILFQWIKENRSVYVIGSGDISFQFVHAHDLMDFYMLALDAGRSGTYNVGTDRFGTLRGDLERLIRYAGSTSEVRSLPEGLTINTLRLLYWLRVSPLVPWHYLTYHKACYFDVEPLLAMGWQPRYGNLDMLQESYDWFLANAEQRDGRQRSPHRSPIRQGVLWLVKQFS